MKCVMCWSNVFIDNGGTFLVGKTMTYSDILVIHAMTWFVEEVRKIFLMILIHLAIYLCTSLTVWA